MHFNQADTIVPNPGDPADYNRFAYARYNSLKYTDPSGHLPCFEDGYCPGKEYSEDDHLDYLIDEFAIEFIGNWENEYKWIVIEAVRTVGSAFLNILAGTSASVFKDVFGLTNGNKFLFEWDENCWGCRTDPVGCDAGTTTGEACVSGFGYTNGENWIEFASFSAIDVPLRNINNVIHELGHAFNIRLGRTPEDALNAQPSLLRENNGFYGSPGNRTW